MEKLKPYPFCGSNVVAVYEQDEYDSAGRFYAVCYDCWTLGPRRKNSKKAIEAWNRRVKDECDGFEKCGNRGRQVTSKLANH